MKRRSATHEIIEMPDISVEQFVKALPLVLDMSGIFFVEARKRVRAASHNLEALNVKLQEHRKRLSKTNSKDSHAHPDNPWTDLIHGVSGLETIFGKTIRDFAVADVLLVASAESYINAIAEHVLSPVDASLFDKLSPTGKWLFLPGIMKLKWKPDSSKGHLHDFAAVVVRRNKFVHPKKIAVKNIANVQDLIGRLRMNTKLAERGLKSVEGLIASISSSWRGSSGPDWLIEGNANSHPPCFLVGSPEAYLRLGRSQKNQSSGV